MSFHNPGPGRSSDYVHEPHRAARFDLGRDPIVPVLTAPPEEAGAEEPLYASAIGMILWAVAVTAIATSPAVVIAVWQALL